MKKYLLLRQRHGLHETAIKVGIDDYINVFRSVYKDNNFFNLDDIVDTLSDSFSSIGKQVEFTVNPSFKGYKIEGKYTLLDNFIEIYVSPDFYDIFTTKYIKVESIFKGVIIHEIIHREQSKKVSFRYHRKNNYPIKVVDFTTGKENLRHTHEVMAYASSISNDLRYEFRNSTDILEFLKKPYPGISDDLDVYIKVFKNEDNKTLKLLYRYIYEYIIK